MSMSGPYQPLILQALLAGGSLPSREMARQLFASLAPVADAAVDVR